jgi:O-antigen ligase
VDSAVPLIVVALLAAGAVLVRTPRLRAASMLGALILTPIILLSHIWDTSQLAPLRDHPLYAAVAGVVAIAVIAAAAWLSRDRPAWLALAAAAAVPFRIPIASGGSTANLLVPLYAVMAAAVLAHLVPRLLGRIDEDDAGEDRVPAPVEWALMGYVVLYAIQASYSGDFDHALEQVVFFYVPFALLYAVLVRVPWTARLVAQSLGVLVVLSIALVAVGFVEYATRTLLLNPKVIASNQFSDYFRVNSLFFDPNIYGRFLIIVMLGVVSSVLWARTRGWALAGALVLVYLWAGLVLTLSQSSFTALLVGLAVLAVLRWKPGRAVLAVVAVLVVGLAVVAVAGDRVHISFSSNDTSGRSDLVSGGVRLFRSEPLVGHGSGSFARDYRAAEHTSVQRAASASHTIPITVAAEQGLIGLLVYLALVILALITLLRGSRGDPVRAGIAAAFVALLVHTLLYAAFLEDPLAWVLLAAGVALARAREAQPS